MNSTKKGVTLIELIIVITVIAIIIIPFSNAFKTTLTLWKKGSTSLDLSKTAHIYTSTLKEKLKHLTDVSLLSTSSNTQGYISFTTASNESYIIFLNSTDNQNKFNRPNTLATSNIIISLVEEQPTTELLIPNTNHFSLESYIEDSSLAFKVVSANNVTTPNYDEINSIKFIIKVEDNNQIETIEHIVDLSKTPIKATGELIYGTQNILFQDITKETTEIELELNEFLSDGDIIKLEQESKTVTIQNSGLYFETISEAIAQAKTGDTILVGYKEEGYNENINISAGIHLKGGYNPITWERNLTLYPSVINTKEGINIASGITSVVLLNSNSILDGFQIDARTLDIAVYVTDAENITIKNTNITNCDIGIYIQNSGGNIIQNDILANKNTLLINQASSLNIIRNILNSNNFAQQENVIIENSSQVTIANNLISNGYSGIDLSNITNCEVIHNAVTNAQNFAIDLTNLNGCTLYNNVIAKNNIGIILSSTNPGSLTTADINSNFFANNKFGNSFNFSLNASNIAVSLSDIQWENDNPYFLDNTLFNLRQTSALIDAGINAQERYTNANPSLGTQSNDIGLYGGLFAGRVGIAEHISLSQDLTSSTITTYITQSFPGDHLVFTTGEFEITTPIELKEHQYLGGTHSLNTQLKHLSPSTLINVANNNDIEHFLINANTNNAIYIANSTQHYLQNIIIKDANTAITLENSIANLRHLTLYNTNTGIRFNNSSGQVSFSIFDTLNLGIENTAISSIISTQNIFTNTNTLYSGNITNATDYVDTFSNLRSPAENSFELNTTANAINFHSHNDVGAVEYYLKEGIFKSKPITSSIDRHYKSLSFEFLINQSQDSSLSEIEIEFENNNTTFKLPTSVLLDNETITSANIDLPIAIIADKFNLNIYLKSYRFNSTPHIDSLKLSW